MCCTQFNVYLLYVTRDNIYKMFVPKSDVPGCTILN